MPESMQIESFFDPNTSTISHLLIDRHSGLAAVIDCVLDYDPKSGRTSTATVDQLIQRIQDLEVKLQWILETHVHADHLSAAPYLKEKLGGTIAMSEQVRVVQAFFSKLFNVENDCRVDGSQFDLLLTADQYLTLGTLSIQVMATPGHTPACSTYVVRENNEPVAAFVGDTIFMPDVGTARCDFPGGDARVLYQSVQRIFALPPATKLYLCHDYPPANRSMQTFTTVAEERSSNIQINDRISEAEFVAKRQARDATLAMPVLLLPAVQINMRAGQLPSPEDNGVRYLKIPLNQL